MTRVDRLAASQLVLSLFPGIGLLDRAFEEEGFCIVRVTISEYKYVPASADLFGHPYRETS